MSIQSSKKELRSCQCGCRQEFPLFSGLMGYGEGNEVAFRAAHMQHGDSGPHVWLLLGSGPWFDGDDRGCWVILHMQIAEGSLVTRIEDAEDSPFNTLDIFGERFVARAEVLAKQGAVAWTIDRRVQFAIEHEPTSSFILNSDMAQQAIAADRAKKLAPAE